MILRADVYHQDPITLARKSLRNRHACHILRLASGCGLRNGLIPLVTLWALGFSALLSGSVVTESIFSWPGIGQTFLRALGDSDLDLLMAIVMFTGVLTVVFNLIAQIGQ